jgi:hypothetical protein
MNKLKRSPRVRDSPQPVASHGLAASSVWRYIFTDPKNEVLQSWQFAQAQIGQQLIQLCPIGPENALFARQSFGLFG